LAELEVLKYLPSFLYWPPNVSKAIRSNTYDLDALFSPIGNYSHSQGTTIFMVPSSPITRAINFAKGFKWCLTDINTGLMV